MLLEKSCAGAFNSEQRSVRGNPDQQMLFNELEVLAVIEASRRPTRRTLRAGRS